MTSRIYNAAATEATQIHIQNVPAVQNDARNEQPLAMTKSIEIQKDDLDSMPHGNSQLSIQPGAVQNSKHKGQSLSGHEFAHG